MGGQRSNVDNPTIAKSYAMWKAMEVYKDFNFNKVIFEGDAQVIVNAVNDVQEDFSIYGSVIEYVKKLLQTRNGWMSSLCTEIQTMHHFC